MTKETAKATSVEEAILTRRSIRAFLPTPVDPAVIKHIFEVARRAPSGSNMQPWTVYVLTGEAKLNLSRRLLEAYNADEGPAQHEDEFPYYPSHWFSPYIERRRALGWALYGLLGLTRENKAGMKAQLGRNFSFFDAPVGLVFTADRRLERGSWLDYGTFLQNVMLMARAYGLDTCPQAAFNQFHRIIAAQLGLPENETIVCGMSLGYADMNSPENGLVSEREEVTDFVHFVANGCL